MIYADLDLPAQAAVSAYVDALYEGASEFVALYAAVTTWLSHHPGMLVDEARETIAAIVGVPFAQATQNVIPLRR